MKIKSGFFILLFLILVNFAHAEVIGKILPLTGFPIIHSTPEIQVNNETDISLKDRISTGSGITAKAILNNGSSIVLKENTEMTFHRTFIKVKHGNSSFSMHKSGNKYKIYTPAVTIGIYGTDFDVVVSPSGDSEVSLKTGKIKVTSIWGKRDSHFLSPGESIKGTRTGLSKVYKTKLFLQIDGYSKTFTSEQSEIVEAEEEEIFSDLELNGDLCCYFMIYKNNRDRDFIETSWDVKVNGYDMVNGKKLSFYGGQKAFLRNLEPGYYDFTVILNGIEYSFPYELNKKNSGSTIKLLYNNFTFDIQIGDTMRNLQYPEILEHIKVFVTSNGIRNQVYYKADDKNKSITGYHMIVVRGHRIDIYYPIEMGMPSMFEFYYDGKIETKEKYIKFIPSGDKFGLEIKF